MKSALLTLSLLFSSVMAIPCISNVSTSQSNFRIFYLHWTNGCPSGTIFQIQIRYEAEGNFVNFDNYPYNASNTDPQVTPFFINAVNRVEIRRRFSDDLVYTTTFTSLAAPPVVSSSGPSFSEVESRALSLQWDSDIMYGVTPYSQNPLGTSYEVELSTSATFEFSMVQSVTHSQSPDTATVGCLSPDTRYYARVRAVNLGGVPTEYLVLGSTVTLEAVPPPTVYTWGGNQWGLSVTPGEIPDEGVMIINPDPLGSPLSSPGLPRQIQVANNKLTTGDHRQQPLPNGLVEIQASRTCPVRLESTLTRSAALVYDVGSLGAGIETGQGRVREDTLSFYRLDVAAGVWMKIPSRLEGRYLTTNLQELGTIAIMGQEDVSLQDLRVSPNPFHQNTDTHITFSNLAERATVRIYTPSGREVRRLEESDGDGLLDWDGRNSDGNPVELGIYVFYVESPGAKKTGKVLIIQ
jgi:hypothetical protein